MDSLKVVKLRISANKTQTYLRSPPNSGDNWPARISSITMGLTEPENERLRNRRSLSFVPASTPARPAKAKKGAAKGPLDETYQPCLNNQRIAAKSAPPHNKNTHIATIALSSRKNHKAATTIKGSTISEGTGFIRPRPRMVRRACA